MLYFTPQKINMQPWSNIFTERGTHILFEEKILNSNKINNLFIDYYLLIIMEEEENTVSRIALFLLKLKNYNSKDSIE